MIYHYLVSDTCGSGERIFSTLTYGSSWSSGTCMFHGDGICGIKGSSILHHAPVGALLCLMKTNSNIYREAQATLVQGADLTVKAPFPDPEGESLGMDFGSFIAIIESFLQPLTTRMCGNIRALRLDQSSAPQSMSFGISTAASCAILMINLDRLCPSLERLDLFIDVGMEHEEDDWKDRIRQETVAAVKGLAAGSTKIQLRLLCASFVSTSGYEDADEVDDETLLHEREVAEARLTDIRAVYTAARKKKSDKLVARASHYEACFDGSYLLATQSLRSLTMEDSE